MALHQFGEGVLRVVADKSPEQIKVARCHFHQHIAATHRNPTKIL
ncbi:MAG TPA: hypothetical protein VGI63_03395 [Verrucomicrobiae bacterium]